MIERIEPGRNPGGLWARTVTKSGTVLFERAINTEIDALVAADEDSTRAADWLDTHQGDTVYNVVHDGDTGEVMVVTVAGSDVGLRSRSQLTSAPRPRRWWP